jgi:tetratricopeptide (TPR) repeat protein
MSAFNRLLLAVILFLASAVIIGQEVVPDITSSAPDELGDAVRDAPAWLLRNRGRAARLDRNLPDAFLLLTRSLEKDPNNPETLTELALSYAASNDFHQALEHLNKALDNRAMLSSPDLLYTILYQLADIYRQNRSSPTYVIDYERILTEITANDEAFSTDENFQRNLRASIRDVLLATSRDGTSLDRMVTLYRLEDSFSLRAHVLLGEFYVHSGRYDEALEHLTFAVLKMYSLVIEKLREEDPLYAFQDSRSFFRLLARNEDWLEYLREAGFPKALYYLGAAIYGYQEGQPAVYRNIWQTVIDIPFENDFARRAASMLENPRREEILYGSSQFLEEVNNR